MPVISLTIPEEYTVSQIRQALAASSGVAGARILPTLVIDRPEAFKSWKVLKGGTAADGALWWYRNRGFCCDRTRMNLYGYAGLLRDLSDPPPWVNVEPEDMEEDIPEERARELRSFIYHAQERSESELLQSFRDDRKSFASWSEPLTGWKSVPGASELQEESFLELVGLAKALGADSFSAIFDAVFDFDEFSVSSGAPDMLVWLQKPGVSCWFFSEVKAPGDYLRSTQTEWLRQHWDIVRGHYLLTILADDSPLTTA